jgi:hypothetical protein
MIIFFEYTNDAAAKPVKREIDSLIESQVNGS